MARRSSPAAVLLGANISAIRRQRTLTVDQLAVAAAIDSSNIRGYEAGRGMMGLKTLFKIAEALQATPAELLEGISITDFDAD